MFTFAADQNGKFPDGSSPAAGLVEGRDGFLYGTTEFGGASNSGVLFRVEKNGSGFQVLDNSALLQPAAIAGTRQLRYFKERMGISMGPLGRVFFPCSFRTQVTIQGDHSSPKSLERKLHQCNVPSGATSGPITVTNPGGTSKSASTFLVQ